MKYVNGLDILPEELLNEIRNYAEGVYVYIPKSDSKKKKWGERTNFHSEMELRNLHIYDKYLEGVDIKVIAERYHLSIKSIRRIILTQKRKMEVKANMIKEILKEWNLVCNPIQIYHTAWNINDTYVLKIYDNPVTLQRNIMMMRTLYEAGIPVPEIIKLPNGQDYFEQKDRLEEDRLEEDKFEKDRLEKDKFYMLTTKLNGNNVVDLNKYDDNWFFELGRILGKLHIAFRDCEKKISYWKNSMLEEMTGWVSRDLLKFKPDYLKEEDIKASIDSLTQVYEELPKQLIHRDVHLGNFLFNNGVFSGYIDFDLSQSNIRIFDLCYFLLGIRLEEDNNRVNEEKWYEIVRQVIAGYDSLLELNGNEKSAISCVMKNIELLFVAYFLGIGDEKLAKDSANLFLFIKRNEEKIQNAVLKINNF